jgi:hypothetical protein
MSQDVNTPQNNSEEVDLIGLFKLLGKAIGKVFKFIASIFKAIFSAFIYSLKAILENFRLVSIVVVICALTGYGLERYSPKVYSSQMLVKPYFDSKYQLISNIDYFNSLIENDDYEKLTTIFGISKAEAEKIKSFEIESGPESDNEKIQEYSRFLKTIDSTLAEDISFDDFLENRDIYASSIYKIIINSTKKDIFKTLEAGLNSSFENTYSEKKMKKRDSLIYIEKQNILSSLASVDSLQKVYIDVLKEESKSNSNKISLGEGFTLEPDRSKTKEYELLNKEIELKKELRALDKLKVEEDVFFDTISGFQEIGSISESLLKKYSLIFPALGFFILSAIFLLNKTIKFIRSYE